MPANLRTAMDRPAAARKEPPTAARIEEPPSRGDAGVQPPRLRRAVRAGHPETKTIKRLVRDIPNFLKLLGRLAIDPRVSRVDKGLVVLTIAYVAVPMDLIPDYIPFLGRVDDLYLVALALDRLLSNTGIEVLLEHWDGDSGSLETAIAALDRAGSFLPERVRSLVRSLAKER